MSTFIINLNDTITMSDSAVVELAKLVSACQPCELEAQTNCNDVWIVVVICATFVIVALIVTWAIWSWQKAVIKAEKDEREKKESEDKIAERKQKADALNKLIDYLGKNTVKEKYDAEEGKRIKEEKGLDSKEGRYYMGVLSAVITGNAIPNYPIQKQVDESKTSQRN